MKTKTPNAQTFNVTSRTVVISSVDVPANSLEEAVQKAKELKLQDFIETIGDFYDGSSEVISVSNNNKWKTD